MQKISFTINGRRFEVELEDKFALFVKSRLQKAGIANDRNNDTPKILNAYLQALKENFDNENQIESLLVEFSTK